MEEVDNISYDLGKKMAIISYALCLTQFFIPFLGIVGLIIAYIHKKRVKGTILYSHFKFQIKIFWITFVLEFICIILCLILIGYLGLIGLFIWQLYMYIFGLVKLLDNKAII